MRLRTRLAAAFLVVGLLPLGAVVPLALEAMREALGRELQGRLEGAAATAQAFFASQQAELVQGLRELAESAALRELEQALELGDTSELRDLGERLMHQRGLGVLAVLDEEGLTVTSGHWPARLNDPDPTLLAVTRAGGKPQWVTVDVLTPDGPRPTLALVAAVRAGSVAADPGGPGGAAGEGRTLWVVGGPTVGTAWAQSLSQLTLAKVGLYDGKRLLGTAGRAAQPVLEREVGFGDRVHAVLTLSRAPLLEAEARLTRAAWALCALGLLLAFGLAVFVARRITRPVEALTRASRSIAEGDLEARVEGKAPGEVGELVRAFNRMGTDLRATTRRLVAAERVAAWQEVARGLAHELKNPLTPIRMSLETLVAAHRERHPSFGELFAQSAPAMLEEVERLRRTVDEFSRFARLPSPTLAELDLSSWAEQTLALHGALPPHIRLERDITPGLHVRADRDLLTQVVVNLLRNAEDAVGEKGGRITVRVRPERDQALLEVQDTGPGIPPALRERVLEPHFTTKAHGSGLGLAIAARICQEHGGALEVADAPGGGALLRVSLPVRKLVGIPPGA